MAKKKGIATVEAYGLGLEYMIVDRGSMLPMPPASIGGAGRGVEWTTNNAGTGIRLSTTGPEKNLEEAAKRLATDLVSLRALVEGPLGGMILPTGAHPFAQVADPRRPLGTQNPRSAALDVLFNTAGPGWLCTFGSRIELPFANDGEFARLHTAIRMVLPLVPAISASSPFLEGTFTGALSSRSMTLRNGRCRVPELIGAYVPEVALDQEDYYRIVLGPIAQALAERGLADAIDYHLVNSRAAVPSFDRGVISIDVADMQECVSADAAIAEIVIAVTRAMVSGRWVSNYLQRAWHESDLLAILNDLAERGGEATIANRDFLLMFGMMRESATAAELWRHLYQQLRDGLSENCRMRIAHVLDHGSLAARILQRTGQKPSQEAVLEVYRELASCLQEDRQLVGAVGA